MRNRKQNGTIFKAHGAWHVRYFEDRVENGVVKHKRVSKRIAKVTTRGKHPPKMIRDEADRIVARAVLNNRTPDRVLTMGDFFECVYLPYAEKHKRPSTVHGYRNIWTRFLKARCAHEWLREVRTFHVQAWLDDIAANGSTRRTNRIALGRNTLKHIKTLLSAVFKHARQQGYSSEENPVRDTRISPTASEPSETYAYSIQEIYDVLERLPERARCAFALAAFAGLRRGEVFGLRWEDFHDGMIYVSRAFWEGHTTEPKTRRSKGGVPVIRKLGELLEIHRLSSGEKRSGYIFANAKGTPLNPNNLVNRDILPALNRCAVCGESASEHCDQPHEYRRDDSIPKWRGWHAARRGLATNLHRLGVFPNVIQQVLRHARVSVTTDYYIKTAFPEVQNAMELLERALPEASAWGQHPA